MHSGDCSLSISLYGECCPLSFINVRLGQKNVSHLIEAENEACWCFGGVPSY